MDAPKCRLCGVRHWGLCVANKPMANTESMANDMANVESQKDNMQNKTSGGSVTYKYRDAEKRRGYMREYMRNKRGGNEQV